MEIEDKIQQEYVCKTYGSIFRSTELDTLVVTNKTWTSIEFPMSGFRIKGRGGMPEWYIWFGLDDIPSDLSSLETVTVEALLSKRDLATAFLGLDYGWCFNAKYQQTRVWFDENILNW